MLGITLATGLQLLYDVSWMSREGKSVSGAEKKAHVVGDIGMGLDLGLSLLGCP